MSATPPGWLVAIGIEPKSKADQENLSIALARMAAEDSSFVVFTDEESGRVMIGGMDERDLDIKLNRLRRTVQVHSGAPEVAYREGLGRRAEIHYAHKKQLGGGGEFAFVKLVFEPGAPGSGFAFETTIAADELPEEYILAVREGLESVKDNGLLAGFPLTDFTAILIGGAWHDVDSSALTFETAARGAFAQLREKGEPQLLEPIMKVEVLTPDGWIDDVIDDLKSRGGRIEAVEVRGVDRLVTAMTPLATLFGYGSTLAALTQDRAWFTLRYDHYAPTEYRPDLDPDTFPPAAAMRA